MPRYLPRYWTVAVTETAWLGGMRQTPCVLDTGRVEKASARDSLS